MKRRYVLKTFWFLLLFITAFSCGPDDADDYTPVTPVEPGAEAMPFPKLSDYDFFIGELKNLEPAAGVLPYDLNSALFTDYAHKKRFVWMPAGKKATYDADGKILNFPVGAVLIKNFYYDNVQPGNTTVIIETRLMIRQEAGWRFANYIWDDAQTDAVYNMAGGFREISWIQDGEPMITNYEIPSTTDCFTCHKTSNDTIPIGPKPQNLNKVYNYANGPQNQLQRWIAQGYLDTAPHSITTTVDWTDKTKPLDLRVRSYLDINCAHCHKEGSHCDYRPMRFAFSETTNPANLGICVAPQETVGTGLTYIVAKKSPLRSVMRYRLNSVNQAERMPLLGRTIKHTEAVALIEEWINAMDAPCP